MTRPANPIASLRGARTFEVLLAREGDEVLALNGKPLLWALEGVGSNPARLRGSLLSPWVVLPGVCHGLPATFTGSSDGGAGDSPFTINPGLVRKE